MPATRYLTPLMRDRLVKIDIQVSVGATRAEAARSMGVSNATLLSTLARLFGDSTWPPVIDPRLFELPVYEQGVPTNGGRRSPTGAAEYAEISVRAAQDQARIKAERERWLDIEKEKYGLKRRGRSIDDMPA